MWQGPFDLENRNVVITGIGFAIAKNLGQRGCRIMIAEPDEQRLQNAVESLAGLDIDATYQICDVTKLDQVEQLAEQAWNHFAIMFEDRMPELTLSSAT